MPSKSTKSTKRAAAPKPSGPSKAEARSNAAETQRLEAKHDRTRAYLAENRRREAELTAKGYFF
jgi:hypothetical protein